MILVHPILLLFLLFASLFPTFLLFHRTLSLEVTNNACNNNVSNDNDNRRRRRRCADFLSLFPSSLSSFSASLSLLIPYSPSLSFIFLHVIIKVILMMVEGGEESVLIFFLYLILYFSSSFPFSFYPSFSFFHPSSLSIVLHMMLIIMIIIVGRGESVLVLSYFHPLHPSLSVPTFPFPSSNLLHS